MFQEHSIDRCTIQFSAPEHVSKDLVRSLAREKEEIAAIIEEVLNKCAPGDKWVDVDKIHLHLGTMPSNGFSREFKDRLRRLLETELVKFLNRHDVKVYIQEQTQNATLNSFQLFRQYLMHGFNEQLQADRSFDPDLFVEKLYGEDKDALASVIKDVWADLNARKRLAQFKPAIFSKIMEMLPLEEYKLVDGEHSEHSAFAIVRFYYNTGEFPVYAHGLKLADLEVLVDKVLQDNKRELLKYFQDGLADQHVVVRLSETLTLATLKKIVSQIPGLQASLETWNIWEALLMDTTGLSPLILTGPGKGIFLQFLNLTTAEEKARLLYDQLQLARMLHRSNVDLITLRDTLKRSVVRGAVRGAEAIEAIFNHFEIIDKTAHQRQDEASKVVKDNSLEHLTFFFMQGTLQDGSESIPVLLLKLLRDDRVALKSLIRQYWHKFLIRQWLALKTDLALLESITQLVWEEHSSYGYWQSFKDLLQEQFAGKVGQEEKTLRAGYGLYFDFLFRHERESWDLVRYREWMYAGVKNRLPEALVEEYETFFDHSKRMDKVVHHHREEALKIEKDKGLEHLTFFFRHGTLQKGSESIPALLLKLLRDDRAALKSLIREYWHNPLVRHWLALKADLTLLELITRLVWEEHNSYLYWQSFKDLLQKQFAGKAGQEEKALSAGYGLYFDFLFRHEHERWAAFRFRDWMYAGMKELSFEGISVAQKDLEHEYNAAQEGQHSLEAILSSGRMEDISGSHAEDGAFAIVSFYYSTGVFPAYAERLKLSDLEILVEKVLRDNQRTLLKYFEDGLSDDDFVLRLSETLTLAKLKAIARQIVGFQDALNTWNVWEEVLKAAGLSPLLFTGAGKVVFLQYLRPAATEEKALILYDQLQLAVALYGSTPAFMILLDALKPDVVNEIARAAIEDLFSHIKKIQQRTHQGYGGLLKVEGDVLSVEDDALKTERDSLKVEDDEGTDKSLRELIFFFNYGTLKDPSGNVSALLLKLFSGNRVALKSVLREYWPMASVRHRLVVQTDLVLLASVTQLVWGQHNSYLYWESFKDLLQSAYLGKGAGQHERILRESYNLYFDFLSRHAHESWDTFRFREWMYIGLKELSAEGASLVSRKDGAHQQRITDVLLSGRKNESGRDDAEHHALTIIRFYYTTGDFPVYAQRLKLSDQEMLVNMLWTENRPALIQYVDQHINDKEFVIRFSETLPWDTLEKITGQIARLKAATEEWKTFDRLLMRSEAIGTMPRGSAKITWLNYLRLSSAKEKAGALYDHLKFELSLQGKDFSPEGIETILTPRALDRSGSGIIQEIAGHLLEMIVEAKHRYTAALEDEQEDDWAALPSYFNSGVLGSQYKSGSQFLHKLLSANAQRLALYIRDHWPEQVLRYRIALLDDVTLPEVITALLWKEHYSYVYWNAFKDLYGQGQRNNGSGQYEKKESDLYILYFEFLYRHGQEQWREARFKEWMDIGLDHLAIKEETVQDGTTEVTLRKPSSAYIVRQDPVHDNIQKAVSAMLHLGIKKALPFMFRSHHTDLHTFWDEVLSHEQMVFTTFQGAVIADGFWQELVALLSDVQRQYLLYILAPFQHDHINGLLKELQRYVRAGLPGAFYSRDEVYAVLFKRLHASAYAISKQALAVALITYIFRGERAVIFFYSLKALRYSVTDFERNFPKLHMAIMEIWPEEIAVCFDDRENTSPESTAILEYLKDGDLTAITAIKVGLPVAFDRWLEEALHDALPVIIPMLPQAQVRDRLLKLAGAERFGRIISQAISISDKTKEPTAIQKAVGIIVAESGRGESGEGVRQEDAARYDTWDLIHYYLKAGVFPVWAGVKTVGELGKIMERYFEKAPSATAEKLSVFFREPEIYKRLTPLLSPPRLLQVKQVLEEKHTGKSVAYAVDTILERQRIDVLLHCWTFSAWPWWYTASTLPDVVATMAHKQDLKALKTVIVERHLEAFLAQLQQMAHESAMVDLLLRDLSLSDFLRVINLRFPSVSGFIVTTFMLLNDESAERQSSSSIITDDLYVFVYRFLLRNAPHFSARDFIRYTLIYISGNRGIDGKTLRQMLIERSEALTRHQDMRFWVVLEILKEQTDGDINVEEPVFSSAVTSAGDEDESTDDPESFKEALTSYIRFGTIPVYKGKGILSREDFLERFDRLTPQETEAIQFVIKSYFSNLLLMEAFVARADSAVLDSIIKVLSAERYETFVSWRTALEDFMRYGDENVDVLHLRLAISGSLLLLLVSKNDFSITLVHYIQHTLNTLSRHGKVVQAGAFAEKVKVYKAHAVASPWFVSALETVAALMAEHERQLLMRRLLEQKPAKKMPEPEVRITGRLPVYNAGIVLIAPFLYRYFDKLEMIHQQQFKNEALSQRAVQLLQFVVSGSTATPEHDMVLNKILCGVNIRLPVDRSIVLTEQEREVSESLLQGVLQNWDKLKTKSIDSLREGFLLRDGYLEETELGWSLEVDRKAMDVLVDLIPWSFNMIKLSWMERSLKTIWQSTTYRDLM